MLLLHTTTIYSAAFRKLEIDVGFFMLLMVAVVVAVTNIIKVVLFDVFKKSKARDPKRLDSFFCSNLR
jgi:hypothetical protein